MPSQFSRVLIAVLFVLVVGAGGYVLFGSGGSEPQTESVAMRGAVDFNTASDAMQGFSRLTDTPPVPLVDMLDEAGNTVTFEKFRGKVVVLNLWATWCPPCIREMPDLDALQRDYQDRDFLVVPVASGKQGREEPAEFLRARGLTALTTYYDPRSNFLRTFDLETLPTTFVIDRQGRMRGGVVGMVDWHSDRAKAVVEALLNEPS